MDIMDCNCMLFIESVSSAVSNNWLQLVILMIGTLVGSVVKIMVDVGSQWLLYWWLVG